jgi:hypothetical protein
MMKDTSQKKEEELIVLTEKQYQDIIANVGQLEKGKNARSLAKNISQVLTEARRQIFFGEV